VFVDVGRSLGGSSTVEDTGSDEGLDRVDTKPANRHPRSDDQGMTTDPLAVRQHNGLHWIHDLDADHFGSGDDFSAELEGLTGCSGGQIASADSGRETQVVLDT
jgi:hypothetical protein